MCGDGSRHHTASRRAELRSLRRGQPWTPAEVEPLTLVSTYCRVSRTAPRGLYLQDSRPRLELVFGPVTDPPRKQPRAPLLRRTWDPEPTHTAATPQPSSKDTHRQHEHGSRRAGQPVSPRKAWASRGTLWTEGPGEWVSTQRGAGLGRGDGRSQETQDPGKGMCRPQAQRTGLRCGLRTGSRGMRDTKAGACRGGGAWRAEATLREVPGLPRPQE